MYDREKCAVYAEEACDRPNTPLDRLDDMARQADRLGDIIESFISRCKGSTGDCAGKGLTPVPTGHFGNLDRLQSNLERAEKLAVELSDIG